MYDFKHMLILTPPGEIAQIANDEVEARWADYGRAVYEQMNHPRFMVALNDALMKGRGAPDIQRRIITFLTTGTIAS